MIPPTSLIPIHDDNPTRSFPYVTVGLIALNVIVFLTEPHFGRGGDPVLAEYLYRWGLVPWEITHGHQLNLTGCVAACFTNKNVYLPLVTSTFLHAGPLHLAGNMLFLWVFGNNIEDTLGKARFVAFYLLCGVIAGLVHVALNPNSMFPTVGASGAIAGVLGAYLVLFPRARVLTFAFITLVPLPAMLVLGLWFVLQLFTGASQQIGGGGVAWGAHVGGFVAGAILVVLFGGRGRARERRMPPPPPFTPLPGPEPPLRAPDRGFWGPLGP
jgi:membrane associated rhomboid family serine protease